MIVKGATRTVILTKKYAFKIPRLRNWRSLFWGMLSNNLEQQFWKTKDTRLCPILFSLPVGLLNVMPRCKMVTEDDISEDQMMDFINGISEEDGMVVPAEPKLSSFGWWDGEPVVHQF